MLKNDLEKLGFTPEEMSVYVSLLELGGGIVSKISGRSGIHRVSTYNVLQSLEAKGFVNRAKRRGVQFYQPVNPNTILNKIEENYNTAKILVPELLKLQNAYSFKPNIQLFEGKTQIKTIFEKMLNCESEVVGYTNFETMLDLYKDFFEDYNDEALDKGVKHRLFCPDNDFHTSYIKKALKKHVSSHLFKIFPVDPKKFTFKNAQYIFGNSVAVVSLDIHEMVGCITESKDNAETNRNIFNLGWFGAR